MHQEEPVENSSKNDQRPYQHYTKDGVEHSDHEKKQIMNRSVKARATGKIKPKANCRSKVQTSVYVNDLYEQPVCESPVPIVSGSTVQGLQHSLWRPTDTPTVKSHAFSESNSLHDNNGGFNRPIGSNMIYNSYSYHQTDPIASHPSLDQRQNHNFKVGLVESSINHGYSMTNRCDYSQHMFVSDRHQSSQRLNESHKFLTAKQQCCDMSAICQHNQRKYETAPYMSYTDYLMEYSKALCCMQNKMLLQDADRRSKIDTIDRNDSLSTQSRYHAHSNQSKIHKFTELGPVDCKRLTDAAIQTHQNEANNLNKNRILQNKQGSHIILHSGGLPDRSYMFQDSTHVMPHNQTMSREKKGQLIQGGQFVTSVQQDKDTGNSIKDSYPRNIPHEGPKRTTSSSHNPSILPLYTRNEKENKYGSKIQIKNYEMCTGTKSSCDKEKMENINSICGEKNENYTRINTFAAVMQNGVDDHSSSNLEYRKSAVTSVMYQTVREKQFSPKQRMLQKFQHEIKSPNTFAREIDDTYADISKENTFQHQMTVRHLQTNDQLNSSNSICLPNVISETKNCKGKLIGGSNYLTLDANIGGNSLNDEQDESCASNNEMITTERLTVKQNETKTYGNDSNENTEKRTQKRQEGDMKDSTIEKVTSNSKFDDNIKISSDSNPESGLRNSSLIQKTDPTSKCDDVEIEKQHLITKPEDQLITLTQKSEIMSEGSVEPIYETLKDGCTKVSENNSTRKLLTSSTKTQEIDVDSSVTEAVLTGNQMNGNKESTTAIVDETISATPDETLLDSYTVEESLLLESVPFCDSISLSLDPTVNEWSDVPITVGESVSDIFVQSDKSDVVNSDTCPNIETEVIESNSNIEYTVTKKDGAIEVRELNINDSQQIDNHIKYYIIENENIDDKDDNNKFISIQHQLSSANKELDTTTETKASEIGLEVKNDQVILENKSVSNTISTFHESHKDLPKSADGAENVGNNEYEKNESKRECVVQDNGYELLLETKPSEKPIDGFQNISLQTETVNVCTDGQLGDDSFFDCIETEESSFYRTCVDQEEPEKTDIVFQNLAAQSTFTNEQDCHLLDAKIDKHSSNQECFKSLEETIVQHLNKSIEIISQSPPQTVDSTNIMQIQKNLECFNQRIQSAPNDELPLSHSRKVIWDILQLCGSCMIVSQVALDRLKSLVGQTVKNELGFYPDMFIDTLTILFKQASIASTMASNISDDLFFELSSDNSDNDSPIATEKLLPTYKTPTLSNGESRDNSDNYSLRATEKPLPTDNTPTLPNGESRDNSDNDSPKETEKPLPTDNTPTIPSSESRDNSDNDSPRATEKPLPTDNTPTLPNGEFRDNSDNDLPIATEKHPPTDSTPTLPNGEYHDNSVILSEGNSINQHEISSVCAKEGMKSYENNKLPCFNSNEVTISASEFSEKYQNPELECKADEYVDRQSPNGTLISLTNTKDHTDLTNGEAILDNHLNKEKRYESPKDNVKPAELLTSEGQKDSTAEVKADKNTMFTYRNEYFEYKRKRKIKRLSETTIHRSRQPKRDFYCKRRPRSSNFGNSKSCRKLKKDLFELGSKEIFHGIKVPSSIVLNYNEASQFCCHVVLTRTPVTHTKLVSHDRKRSICNQQKSNADIWRETNKHANLAKHERCLNRSSSDSNLISKFLENSYKGNEYFKSFQSKSENKMKVGQAMTSTNVSGKTHTVNSIENQSNERSASANETERICHDDCEKSKRKEHEIEQNICQSYSINSKDNSYSLHNSSFENILPENSSPKTEYEIVKKNPVLDCGFKTNSENRESRSHPKLVPELYLRKVMNKISRPENINDSNVNSYETYEKKYFMNVEQKSTENSLYLGLSPKANVDVVQNDKSSVQNEVLQEEKKSVGNKENGKSHAKNYKHSNTLPGKPISKESIRSHRKLSFEEEISRLDFPNSRKKYVKVKTSEKGNGVLPWENAKCSEEKMRMNGDSHTFAKGDYITDKISACERQNQNSATDSHSINKSSTHENCKNEDVINKTSAHLVTNLKDAMNDQIHKTRNHKKTTKPSKDKEIVLHTTVKQASCPQDHFEKMRMSLEKKLGSDLPKCQNQSFVKGLVTSLRKKLCNQTPIKPNNVNTQSSRNDSDSSAQSFCRTQLKRKLSGTTDQLSPNTQTIKDIDKKYNNENQNEHTVTQDSKTDNSNGTIKKSLILENNKFGDMANMKQRHDHVTKKSKRDDKQIKVQLSCKERKDSRPNATQKLQMQKSTKRLSSERIPASEDSPTKKYKTYNKVKQMCQNESKGKQKHKSQRQHVNLSLGNSKSRMTIEKVEANKQFENLVCQRTVQRVFHDQKGVRRNSRQKQAPNEKPYETNKSQEDVGNTINMNLKHIDENSRYISTKREDEISRIGKWSKLSDIYNVQPLETSDEEEDHTEVVPSTCNDRKSNDADDDDDDAKTVTDFSYLEPKQKIKLKKRWNKICLTNKKSQIYSPQEYLAAAGSSVNEQVDENDLQLNCPGKNLKEPYSRNNSSSKCIDINVKNHSINNGVLPSCEEIGSKEQSIENDLPLNCAEVITKEQSCKNGLQTQCLSKKKGIDLITSEREVIPTYRKRGLVCVQECFTVLDKVYNHKLSEPFRQEVKSKDVPDYYKIIKRGMCYDMVAHKLRNGFYSQVEEFVDDMRLVYSNCYQYHEKKSEIYMAGVEMEAFFDKKMLETFPSFKTSM
ncbi:TRIM24 [Mytilus coruscus]|uniref:TRIM24 n=1 Tax=Mytilus coruscus TaxID=42192 RepID=A0A6J8B1H3_MYTCO|nr:TRIM24 [Mytilus coruscus]